MIAKGNLHAHGKRLADYLTNGKNGERAELAELRDFASRDIGEAFSDIEIQADGTKCLKPFFHCSVRLPKGERLSREEWLYCAGRIEKRLGFTSQSRAVAFHHAPEGESHMHVAWSRIDASNMRAIDPGLYKNKLKEICRELEQELGLTPVRSQPLPGHKTRCATRNKCEESRRLGTDLGEIRETIRACWDRSSDSRSFAAALEEEELTLARGARRDFVVVDDAGGTHALSKRITGVTAQQVRERLADIDGAQLLSVRQVHTRQLDCCLAVLENERTNRAPSAPFRNRPEIHRA